MGIRLYRRIWSNIPSCLIYFSIICIELISGETAKVYIHNSTKGSVNHKILGNNVLGHNYIEGSPARGKQCSMRGSGIWSPLNNKPVDQVIELLDDTGASSLRWPGGCGVHSFNWKQTVGPLINRPHQAFGLPEFMFCSKTLKSDPIITLSDYWGEPEDFADIVEYLNSPIGTNLNAGIDWAGIRAQDGHSDPYNVIWFEYGNETYHGDHNVNELSVTEYIEQYRNVFFAMKSVDKKIKLGAVLRNDSSPKLSYWTKEVIDGTGDIADFYIHHAYLPQFHADVPSGELSNGLQNNLESTKDLFKLTFASTKQFEKYYNVLNEYIFKSTGRKIPLSITEFNGSFIQGKPVPYRHTLGNAVFVADLLQLFMNPKNNINNANNWHFINEYWGMIKGFEPSYEDDEYWQFSEKYWGEKKRLNSSYLKRPIYYVYKLFNDHLGDSLMNIDITSDVFFTDGGFGVIPVRKKYNNVLDVEKISIDPKWEMIEVDGVKVDKLENGSLFVNMYSNENINYYHSFIDIAVKSNTGYTVTAEIRTNGIVDNYGARIDIQDGRGFNHNTHSWAGSNEVKGTEWTTVKCSYVTLPDAENIKIVARRLGLKVPCQFWIRNLTIEPFYPSNDKGIPYISAIASKRIDSSISIILINRHLDSHINVEFKRNTPIASAWAETLSGPSVDATNEVYENNCIIKEIQVLIEEKNIFVEVPPYSVTAVMLY